MKRIATKLISALIAALMLFGLTAGFCRPAAAASAGSRDTVLVLDESGSMYGSAMTHLVAAAEKFCSSVLGSSGKNRVAVVSYSYSARLRCDLTDNIGTLVDAIEKMYANDKTNIYNALEIADEVLSRSDADVKNIVLMSDGLPNQGAYTESGRYVYSDYAGYGYANAVYDKAVSLHPHYTIYTLGFFHSMDQSYKPFAARFLKDLSNATYSQVENVEEIEFTFGNIATQITDNAVKGEFWYPKLDGKGDCKSDYYYSDTYFYDDAFRYKPQLATLSLCLAMSAFGSCRTDDYAEKSRNVRELLTGDILGFTNFDVTDSFKEKPGTDTIAAAIASKPFTDGKGNKFTLIAVAIRGGGYEQEWASNFTIGSSGEHDGFDEASDKVLKFIQDYIADPNNGISGNIKLWITGYSRAAATTNMTAGKIDSGESLGSGVTLDKKDLYAYCFETPAGTIKSGANDLSIYGNIFNIINPNDLVTKVAPTAMGFRRYGYDRVLPTRENKYNSFSQAQANMKDQYSQIESVAGEDYIVGDFVYNRIEKSTLKEWLAGNTETAFDAEEQMTLSAFLDEMISGLVLEDYITRQIYSTSIEDGVRTLCKSFQDEAAFKRALEKLGEKLKSKAVHLLLKLIRDRAGVYEEIAEDLYDCLRDEGIKGISLDDLKTAAVPLIDRVLAYLINHLDYGLTIWRNGSCIFPAHYPELCFAWLRSFDPNYFSGGTECFSSGSYRIIHINCPVDVDVFDEAGNLVARIKDDEADASSMLSVMINSDGEKIVYLPADAGFFVRMQGTDDGKVDYTVNEYSYEAGAVNRIVCYYDVEIKNGEVLRAEVPAYDSRYIDEGTEEGTDTFYSLFDPNNNQLDPNADNKASNGNFESLRFMVNVSSRNEELGKALGSGSRQLGAYAKVMAFPEDGMTFTGWYEGEKLVSSDEEYRFRVTRDVELSAVFAPESGGGISPAMILIIGFAVIALLAAVLIPLLLMNKKDKGGQEETPAQEAGPDRGANAAANQGGWQQNPPGYNAYGVGAYGAGAYAAGYEKPTVAGNSPYNNHYLKVKNGPMEGYTFVLTPGSEIRVGKNPSLVQMVLSSDYPHVSRSHCSIMFDGNMNCFYVVDNSSNGTFVNGTDRLVKGERTMVMPGRELWLGNEDCKIELL